MIKKYIQTLKLKLKNSCLSFIIKFIIILLAFSFFQCSKNDDNNTKEKTKDEYYFLLDLAKLKLGNPIKEGYIDRKDNEYSEKKVALGLKLFNDVRLSKDNTISCASCHNIKEGGTDNLPVSIGINGQKGTRNAPTVINAALNFKLFWDGRADDVEQQAGMPILNPIEMGMESKEDVEVKIRSINEYRELFKKVYPNLSEPITFETITKAIGAFERTLVKPSRFDDFLAGDKNVLTKKEKRGAFLFLSNKCFQCHKGGLVGGLKFAAFGTPSEPYWNFTKSTHHDLGRISITKKDMDYLQFKAPSLRNIEKTAPYFHDGSVKSLTDAIKIMAKIQFETDLNDEEAESIEAFLKTLTSK